MVWHKHDILLYSIVQFGLTVGTKKYFHQYASSCKVSYQNSVMLQGIGYINIGLQLYRTIYVLRLYRIDIIGILIWNKRPEASVTNSY